MLPGLLLLADSQPFAGWPAVYLSLLLSALCTELAAPRNFIHRQLYVTSLTVAGGHGPAHLWAAVSSGSGYWKQSQVLTASCSVGMCKDSSVLCAICLCPSRGMGEILSPHGHCLENNLRSEIFPLAKQCGDLPGAIKLTTGGKLGGLLLFESPGKMLLLLLIGVFLIRLLEIAKIFL